MSSKEEQPSKSTSFRTSTRTKLAKDTIVSECENWTRSWLLKRIIVDEKELCKPSAFCNYLKELCSGDSPRLVRDPKEGRKGGVSYIRIENAGELLLRTLQQPARVMPPTAPREERIAPQVAHVVKNAYRLIDMIQRSSLKERDMVRIIQECLMLESTSVDELRDTYPDLPDYLLEHHKWQRQDMDLQIKMDSRRPKFRHPPLTTEMRNWGKHWIRVLNVLERET